MCDEKLTKMYETQSKGIWPDYLFVDLHPARGLMHNEGIIGIQKLLCPTEIYDALKEKMPEEDCTYHEYLINKGYFKKIVHRDSEKNAVVLFYHDVQLADLEIKLHKVMVTINDVHIRPLRDGDIIREIQVGLDSEDNEQVANAILEIGKYRYYTRKTRDLLIQGLKLTPEHEELVHKHVSWLKAKDEET